MIKLARNTTVLYSGKLYLHYVLRNTVTLVGSIFCHYYFNSDILLL